ncbi:RNA polymerase sigma-70 factor [Lunatibacter salilacus]|uniref:RNA polymerase sigma-70 factor n=1 Tax=Lunatibacter salilacus TaxID=2483804 RepID=UPI00131D0F47|nr:RNA polymerase sigma-70 factor [Lunatibacter salilacus]
MRHIDTLSDTDLLLLLHDTVDSRAFEVIYSRYFQTVYRYVYRIMQDRETSEDLVQNIFIGLWKNPDKPTIENLQAYLFGAAKNQIAKHFRKSKFNSVQMEFIRDWESTNATEEYLFEQDTRATIEAAIRRLPSKCRSVFELSRFSFLSNKEIAQKLGISVFTVENHIKKALYYLRQTLSVMILVLSIG